MNNPNPLLFVTPTSRPGGEDGINDMFTKLNANCNYIFARILTATATLNFGSTGATAVSDLTVSVPGAALGDTVIVGAQHASVSATGVFFGWVSDADTVTVRYSPKATEDPASGVFKVTVLQF